MPADSPQHDTEPQASSPQFSEPSPTSPPPVTSEEAEGQEPQHYVPPEEKRLLGDVLVALWDQVTWGTRVLIGWIALVSGVGAGLFLWVTDRRDVSTAYQVITQDQSPIGSNLGVAGVLLGIFGYFAAPALIGAVVAGVYTANSDVSGRRARAIASKIAKRAALPPGKIHSALNKVKLGSWRS